MPLRGILRLLVVFLVLTGIATAQDEPKTENPQEPESHGTRLRWQDIPKNVLHDQVNIFTSPFHINRDNAKLWVGFGAATAALIATDRKFSNRLPQQNRLTKTSKWTSRMGADYVLFPLWSSFYFVGKAGDNPRARDTGRLGIEALIDADITVNILKVATQRPRPEVQGESVRFFSGGDAFPSGHSIKSWALARVAAREFPHPRIVPVIAYGLATTVSVSRVGGRRHSPSDVLVGSAMGFFIGDFVYRHHHAPSEKSKVAAWVADHVTFQIGGN
jgi:membrane-associated phospholipid phosphatase